MAFSGLSSHEGFIAPNDINVVDVSDIIRELSPYEAPFLNWLGDGSGMATSIDHSYFEDFLRPRTVTNDAAITAMTTSLTLTTAVAEALTVGTILEVEDGTGVTTPGFLQVTGITSSTVVAVEQDYDGNGDAVTTGAVTLKVRSPAGLEGQEHAGVHTARKGTKKTNQTSVFNIPIAASGSALATDMHGSNSFQAQRAKLMRELPGLLEQEVLVGVLNGDANRGSDTETRTMLGLRPDIIAGGNTLTPTEAQFSGDPHLYIGNSMEASFNAGASDSEDWAIVAGATWFRHISNLNDTKVQDSTLQTTFQRKIRQYNGPFGDMTVILSRSLHKQELICVPRSRVNVIPMQGRSFFYEELGKTGDNVKAELVGEYTVEVYHANAMGHIIASDPT